MNPSSFDPTRDYDQEAKDARIDAPSTLYRYAVEYTRYGNTGNVFVRGVDEKDARAQFKMLGPMFPSHARAGTLYQVPAGTHLTPSGIMTIIQRIAARAGLVQGASALSTLRPHDLRRSFAQMAREGGADLDMIKHSLGHSSMVTTERYLKDIQDLKKGRTAPDHIKIKTKRTTK